MLVLRPTVVSLQQHFYRLGKKLLIGVVWSNPEQYPRLMSVLANSAAQSLQPLPPFSAKTGSSAP